VPVSRLSTVTSRDETVASSAMDTTTLIEVALFTVTVPTVIPVPVKLTEAPARKPVPAIDRVTVAAPCGSWSSVTEVTVTTPTT